MKLFASTLRFWPLLLLLPIALLLWLQRAAEVTADTEATEVVCSTLESGCSVQIDGREIRFGMTGVLKPLSPFEIWVIADGAKKAEARFVMQGMDMGFNLYTLRPDEDGVLRAKVTLPICVTGRRDWTLVLDIEKKRLNIPFVTDL